MTSLQVVISSSSVQQQVRDWSSRVTVRMVLACFRRQKEKCSSGACLLPCFCSILGSGPTHVGTELMMGKSKPVWGLADPSDQTKSSSYASTHLKEEVCHTIAVWLIEKVAHRLCSTGATELLRDVKKLPGIQVFMAVKNDIALQYCIWLHESQYCGISPVLLG